MIAQVPWLAVLVIWFPTVSAEINPNPVPPIQRIGVPALGPSEEDLEAEFRQSRDALRASPEFQTDNADTHYRLGKILHHNGDMSALLLDWHDYPGAVAALEQAVYLGRRDGETYYWLGRGLMGKSDWAAAAAAFEAATRVKPDDAEAYADLGLMRMVQGDIPGATQALRVSIELKPDNADAHALLETLTAHQSDRVQVIQAAERILATMFAR